MNRQSSPRGSPKAGRSRSWSTFNDSSTSSPSPVRRPKSKSRTSNNKRTTSNGYHRPEKWTKRDSTIVHHYNKILKQPVMEYPWYPSYPPAEVLTPPPSGVKTGAERGKRKKGEESTEDGEASPPKVVRATNGTEKCLLLRETYVAATSEPAAVPEEITRKSVTSVYLPDQLIAKRDERRWISSDDDENPEVPVRKKKKIFKKREEKTNPGASVQSSRQVGETTKTGNDKRKQEKLHRNKFMNQKNARGQPLFRGQIESIVQKLQQSQSLSSS